MRRKLVSVIAAAGLLGAASPASAALIELSFDFSASDFSGSAVPYDPVTGSLVFTFDNSTNIGATTVGLTISGFTLPSSYTPQYTYYAPGDTIAFSHSPHPFGCGQDEGYDSFCTFIYDASTNPHMTFFYYGSTLSSNIHSARSIQYDASVTTPGAVPEPSAWVLMIVGFGAVGASLRWRRKQAPVLA